MPKIITHETRLNVISEYSELVHTMKPAPARKVLMAKYGLSDSFVTKILKGAGFKMQKSFTKRNEQMKQDFEELNKTVDCMEVVKQLATKYGLTANMIFVILSGVPQFRICADCSKRYPKPPSNGASPERCPQCLAKKAKEAEKRQYKQAKKGFYSNMDIKKSLMILDKMPNRQADQHYSKVLIKTQRGIAQIAL